MALEARKTDFLHANSKGADKHAHLQSNQRFCYSLHVSEKYSSQPCSMQNFKDF